MKIKGVKGGRRQRGDVVEYTPEEKIPLAVKDAVKALNKDDMVYWADKVVVKNHQVHPKSPDALKKKARGRDRFANNVYTADGEVTVRPCNHIINKLKPKQSGTFKITFEDFLDNMGMPDLKVKDVKFSGLKCAEVPTTEAITA